MEGVSKTFRPRRGKPVEAVREATIALTEGRVVAILGPNGSGKTTLLRLCAGLLLPDAGCATVRAGPGEVAWVAPADYGLYGRLTASDLLDWFAALEERDLTPSARDSILARAGLARASDRPIRTLSAGERARLVLARSLLARPRLLLADEPTRSLDPKAREAGRAVLKEVLRGADPPAALLVTHDLEEAEELADEWRVMADGRLGPARPVGRGFREEVRAALAGGQG